MRVCGKSRNFLILLLLPYDLLLLLVGVMWVIRRYARMAMLAGVMIVHLCVVIPNVYGAGPEDEEAEAEKTAVCLLLAGTLTSHHSLSCLLTLRAHDLRRCSLINREGDSGFTLLVRPL